MTYNDLLTKIKEPLPQNGYYALLLANAEVILIQTSKVTKREVAKDLGMSPTIFSIALKFISAHYHANH